MMHSLFASIRCTGYCSLVLCLFWTIVACNPSKKQTASRHQTESMLADNTIITADGSTLPYRCWLPQKLPSAVVLALHGFNDHANFIQQTAIFLTSQGVAVYAYDQHGFGRASDHGQWPGQNVLVDDLKTVVSLLHARYSEIPLYLLGESMGGAVILTALAESEFPSCTGVILAAPAVWSRGTMPWPQRLLLAIASHTVPWLQVSGKSLRIQASDNRLMLQDLNRDPLVIKETRIDALYGLANLMDAAYDAAQYFTKPALILYGEHDEIIPKKPVLHIYQQLPGVNAGRQRLVLYKNGYHMLLRDLQADIVRNDITAWLKEPNRPLPSITAGLAVELCRQDSSNRDLIPCGGS
jgi:acylglycerol lipase